jgi:DNA-binding NtrC family response regulator
MFAVLIVDRDLGFLFWLGDALRRASHMALPSTNCKDAGQLARQRGLPIHVLVVDGTLAGAAALVRALRGTNPRLKVIGLTSEADAANNVFPGAHAMYRRTHGGLASEAEWIAAIEGLMPHDRTAASE